MGSLLEHFERQLRNEHGPVELKLGDNFPLNDLEALTKTAIAAGNKNLIACTPATPELQAFCDANRAVALGLATKIQQGEALEVAELNEVKERIRAVVTVLKNDLQMPHDDIQAKITELAEAAKGQSITIDVPVVYRNKKAEKAPVPIALPDKKAKSAAAPPAARHKFFGLF